MPGWGEALLDWCSATGSKCGPDCAGSAVVNTGCEALRLTCAPCVADHWAVAALQAAAEAAETVGSAAVDADAHTTRATGAVPALADEAADAIPESAGGVGDRAFKAVVDELCTSRATGTGGVGGAAAPLVPAVAGDGDEAGAGDEQPAAAETWLLAPRVAAAGEPP